MFNNKKMTVCNKENSPESNEYISLWMKWKIKRMWWKTIRKSQWNSTVSFCLCVCHSTAAAAAARYFQLFHASTTPPRSCSRKLLSKAHGSMKWKCQYRLEALENGAFPHFPGNTSEKKNVGKSRNRTVKMVLVFKQHRCSHGDSLRWEKNYFSKLLGGINRSGAIGQWTTLWSVDGEWNIFIESRLVRY